MLRLLAEEMGVRVREDKDTVVPVDRAKLCAHVARQAGVTDGMLVAGPHALAHLEARNYRDVSARGPAVRDQRRHFVSSELWDRLGRARRRDSALELVVTKPLLSAQAAAWNFPAAGADDPSDVRLTKSI